MIFFLFSGNLFFGTMENKIACWNSKTPFTSKNIHELVKDDVNLQFLSGMKVKKKKKKIIS